MNQLGWQNTFMVPAMQIAPVNEPFLVVFHVLDIMMGHEQGLHHSRCLAHDFLHSQQKLQAIITAERELVDPD